MSGNPYSGVHGIYGMRLRNSSESSGFLYWGFSGNITITSGGGLASGGLGDGMELGVGQETAVVLPQGGDSLSQITLTARSTVSGRVRVFWHPHTPSR